MESIIAEQHESFFRLGKSGLLNLNDTFFTFAAKIKIKNGKKLTVKIIRGKKFLSLSKHERQFLSAKMKTRMPRPTVAPFSH
jgi:hypothetical protein